MAAKATAARLASAALPSITVPALAEMHGMTVPELGEYIRAEQLTVHVLLHRHEQRLPDEPYTRWPAPSPKHATLDGFYRLPTKWAVAALEGNTGYGCEVVHVEPDELLHLSYYPGWKELRVLREERERFEREVLAQIPKPTPPAIRQNTLDQQRCQALAAYLWSRDPSATIVDVAASQPMKEFGYENRPYTQNTIQDWIRFLCPNHKPGRRPK